MTQKRNKFREDLLPDLRVRDGTEIAPSKVYWSEKFLGKASPNEYHKCAYWCLLAIAFATLCAGVLGILRLTRAGAEVSMTEILSGDETELETGDGRISDRGSDRVEFDAVWSETHKAAIEEGRSVIWKLLLSNNADDRRDLILRPADNEASLKNYDRSAPKLQLDSANISITPVVGWRESYGQRIAYRVATPVNEGFVVEVQELNGNFRVHWDRFVQHYHRRFSEFAEKQPDAPASFYVTIRRIHMFDDQASELFEYFEVSGTNPNEWYVAIIEVKDPIADSLADAVPWNQNVAMVLELKWKDLGLKGRSMVVTRVQAPDWEGDLN